MTTRSFALARLFRLAAAAIALMCAFTALLPAAHATPWMSLQAGTPCATCHTNVQGGGGRTEIGWGSGAYTGLLQWDQLSFDWLAERETNDIVPGYVSLGWDIRSQSARIGAPEFTINDQGDVNAKLPRREQFLMQMQPYLTVTPHESVSLYGTYAIGQGTFENGDGCWTPYAGQSCYEAMAIVRPHHDAPTIRLGVLQPSIGIRHDDHTMLIRGDASRSRAPVIPANYAELGGELSYKPVYWLTLDAGAFQARNLSLSVGDPTRVRQEHLAYSARATFSPLFGERRNLRFATLMGGSVYGAGDFRMENIFLGAGWLNRGSIILESAVLHYLGGDQNPSARNLSLQTNVQLAPWFILQGRVEQGNAFRNETEHNMLAFVGGFQFFPIPYFEIRPEYRHTTADQYVTGQYTIQFHLYY